MPSKNQSDLAFEREQEILNLKRELRRDIRAQRKRLDPDWVRKASARIEDAVIARSEFAEASAVGCYLALPGEVQTRAIIERCWRDGKRVCVPAYSEERERYELTWIEPDTPVSNGRWNISEPLNARRASMVEVDLLIVPAIAFDRHGGRLGHGGGHFDRILGCWNGIKIGIAFEYQIFDSVPMGSQDIPVDLVVTELQVYEGEGNPPHP